MNDDRNDLGYLEDSTLRIVVTKDGKRGVMPAWLAEVTAMADMVVLDPEATP